MIKKLALGLLVAGFISGTAHAQTIASDNASDPVYQSGAGGWTAGDNGGTGFGAWTTVTNGFIGSSTTNGPGGVSGGINTGGQSFGLFSNIGAPTLGEAIRPFGSGLTVGDTFSLQMDNGTVGSGGSVGFGLRSGNTNRFEFYFAGGGTSYTVDGGAMSVFQTAQGFTPNGMTASLTLTSPDTFSFSVAFNGGSTETFTGTLDGTAGSTIDNFRLFTFNTNDNNPSGETNAFFNSPTVVPEPSSLSLLAGPAILGAWFFVRRRRA